MDPLANSLLWSSPAAPPSLDDVWSLAEDEVLLKVALAKEVVQPYGNIQTQRLLAKALANQYIKAKAQRPELFPKSEAFIKRTMGFVERLSVLQDPTTTDPGIIVKRRLLAGGFSMEEELTESNTQKEEEYQSDILEPSKQAIFTIVSGYENGKLQAPTRIVTDGVKAAEHSSLIRGIVSSRNPPWFIDLTNAASRDTQQCANHFWHHIDAGTLGRFLVYCRHSDEIDATLSKSTNDSKQCESQVSASLPTLLTASQEELASHITALDSWYETVTNAVKETVEKQKAEALARVEEKFRQLLDGSLKRVEAVEKATRARAEGFFKGNDEDVTKRFTLLEDHRKKKVEKLDAARTRWVEACLGKSKDVGLLRLISCGVALGAETFVTACSRRLAEGLSDLNTANALLSNQDTRNCLMIQKATPRLVSLCPLESLLILSDKIHTLSHTSSSLSPGVALLKEEVEKELKIRQEAEQGKLLEWPVSRLERALLSARSTTTSLMGKFKLALIQKVLDSRGEGGEDGASNTNTKLLIPTCLAALGSLTEDELTAEVKAQDRFVPIGSTAVLRSTAWRSVYFECSVIKAPPSSEAGPCVALGMFMSEDGKGTSHLEELAREVGVLSSKTNVIKKPPTEEGIFIQDTGHVLCDGKTAFGDFTFGAGDTMSFLIDPQIRLITFYKNGVPLVLGKGSEVINDALTSKFSLPGPGDQVCVVVGLGMVREHEWRKAIDQNVEMLESFSPYQLMPGCVLYSPGSFHKCKVKFRFQPRFMYQIGQNSDDET